MTAAVTAAAIGFAAPALAQSNNNEMNGTNGFGMHTQTTSERSDNNMDRDWSDNDRDNWRGEHGWHHQGRGWDHHGDYGCGRHQGWMMGGGPGWVGRYMQGWSRPRGASFHFQHGNSRIDIQCPARQNLSDCVNAADKILDKLAAMKREAGPATPTPSKPTPPASPNTPGTNGRGAGALPGTPGAQGQ